MTPSNIGNDALIELSIVQMHRILTKDYLTESDGKVLNELTMVYRQLLGVAANSKELQALNTNITKAFTNG